MNRNRRLFGRWIVVVILTWLVVTAAQAAESDLRDWTLRTRREFNPLLFDTFTRYSLDAANHAAAAGSTYPDPTTMGMPDELRQRLYDVVSLQYQLQYGAEPPSSFRFSDIVAALPYGGAAVAASNFLLSGDLPAAASSREAAGQLHTLEGNALYVDANVAIAVARSMNEMSTSPGLYQALIQPYSESIYGYAQDDTDKDIAKRNPLAVRLENDAEAIRGTNQVTDQLQRKYDEVSTRVQELEKKVAQGGASAQERNALSAFRNEDADLTVRIDESKRQSAKQYAATVLQMIKEARDRQQRHEIAEGIRAWTSGVAFLLAPHDPEMRALAQESFNLFATLMDTDSAAIATGSIAAVFVSTAMRMAGASAKDIQHKEIIAYLKEIKAQVVALREDIQLHHVRVMSEFSDVELRLSQISHGLADLGTMLLQQRRALDRVGAAVMAARSETAVYNAADWLRDYDSQLRDLRIVLGKVDQSRISDKSLRNVIAGTGSFATVDALNATFTGADIVVGLADPLTQAPLIRDVVRMRGRDNLIALYPYLASKMVTTPIPILSRDLPNPKLFASAAAVAIGGAKHLRQALPEDVRKGISSNATSVVRMSKVWRSKALVHALTERYLHQVDELLYEFESGSRAEFVTETHQSAFLEGLLSEYYPLYRPSLATGARWAFAGSATDPSDVPIGFSPDVPKSRDALLGDAAIERSTFQIGDSGKKEALSRGYSLVYVKPSLDALFSGNEDISRARVSLPSGLLRRNEVIEALFGLTLSQPPGQANLPVAVEWHWRPIVRAIQVVAHANRGACSTIPVYEEAFGLISYEFDVTIKYRGEGGAEATSRPFILTVDDSSPVLLVTRCWDQTRHILPNRFAAVQVADNISKVLPDVLKKWFDSIDKATSDILENQLRPTRASDGYLEFPAATKVATVKASGIDLEWRFTADVGAKAGLKQLEAIANQYRRQYWSYASYLLSDRSKRAYELSAKLDLVADVLRYAIEQGLGAAADSSGMLADGLVLDSSCLPSSRNLFDQFLEASTAQVSWPEMRRLVEQRAQFAVKNIEAGVDEAIQNAPDLLGSGTAASSSEEILKNLVRPK